MPSSTFFGMQHLNQNLLCAIGIECTGPDPTRHELAEVCVLPMNHMLEMHDDLILFNMKMRIEMPEEIDWSKTRIHKTEVGELTHSANFRDTVSEYFLKWFQELQLPFRKKIIPLTYNYPYVRAVLHGWLGDEIFHEIFQEDYRDVLAVAHYLNDYADMRNEPPPFSKQLFRWIANKMDIPLGEIGGSPCNDAMTLCTLYKRLLRQTIG